MSQKNQTKEIYRELGQNRNDKLDELEWVSVVHARELQRAAAGGRYVVVLQLNRYGVSVKAIETRERDRVFVETFEQDVAVAHACEFCARRATVRHREYPLYRCSNCGAGLLNSQEYELI